MIEREEIQEENFDNPLCKGLLELRKITLKKPNIKRMPVTLNKFRVNFNATENLNDDDFLEYVAENMAFNIENEFKKNGTGTGDDDLMDFTSEYCKKHGHINFYTEPKFIEPYTLPKNVYLRALNTVKKRIKLEKHR